MQNLIFSLNATLPVFLTMVAGWLLRQWGFLPKEFCKAADRLTFKITLPIMLFLDMSAVDILHDFQPKFVLFCFAATLAGILVVWGAAHVLIRDKSIVGAVSYTHLDVYKRQDHFCQAYQSAGADLGSCVPAML